MSNPSHFDPSTSSTATPYSRSSVRPRAARLISGLTDAGNSEGTEYPFPTSSDTTNNYTTNNVISSTSASNTPFESRAASPIPSAHPQRASSKQPSSTSTSTTATTSWSKRAQLAAQKSVGLQVPGTSESLAGLWGQSWNTLQGLASDLLGNEEVSVKEGQKRRRGGTPQPQSRQGDGGFGKWLRASSPGVGNGGGGGWGVRGTSPAAAEGGIGSGTKAERESRVRAQKRKEMLLRQESSYADALGKFKRRFSDDFESGSVPPLRGDGGVGGADVDNDAEGSRLVYIHPVQTTDTTAGITIKYNCTANVLRKANRMWANDTPQSRQTLVIPVAQCGIKGRPVADPASPGLDLLSPEADEAISPGQMDGDVPTPRAGGPGSAVDDIRTRTSSLSTDDNGAVNGVSTGTSQPWHHDSWVQLPGFPQPVQIARLSRRTLGYFPPARRKSTSRERISTDYKSQTSAHNGSLDLARTTTTTTTNLNADSRSSSRAPSQQPRHHGRRLSNASTGYYPAYLTGPGGVGTMNKNVRAPGPAQDGLNKIFAKHLPDVAPPKPQSGLLVPEFGKGLVGVSDEDILGSGMELGSSASGFSTPRSQSNAGGAGGVNFTNAASAIELWARKMAVKVSSPSEAKAQARAARASVGAPGKGGGGIGDLIEMVDEFELAASSEDERDERGRGRGGEAGRSGVSTSAAGGGMGNGTLLGGGGGRKSGKSD